MRFMPSTTIAALGALAACSPAADRGNAANPAAAVSPEPGNIIVPSDEPAPAATPTPVASNSAKDALLGRWTGVEGMYLDIAPGKAPGTYQLAMQWDLDHHGTFVGTSTELSAASIAFVRDGKPEVLRPTDGDATGLKYLAGKRDCLTVKPGEGYCRDTRASRAPGA